LAVISSDRAALLSINKCVESKSRARVNQGGGGRPGVCVGEMAPE